MLAEQSGKSLPVEGETANHCGWETGICPERILLACRPFEADFV